MAKVFKGKQVFENSEAFAAHFKDLHKERGPFRESMLKLNQEFGEHLAVVLSPESVLWYKAIVQVFADFLYWNTDVTKVEEITKGMANSHFRTYWKNKVWDDTISRYDLQMALREFFTFLKTKKGIVNKKVLKSLRGVCLRRGGGAWVPSTGTAGAVIPAARP